SKWIDESEAFFERPEISGLKFEISDDLITWPSAIETQSPENNTVYARYFRATKQRITPRSAVVILPHWNAQAGSYFDLAHLLNRLGMSVLRLTLPYHEERMPPDLERADHLVAPNVGRTLQSVRQAVLDTRTAVGWLKQQGYDRIGLVGTSIGSCTAFLAFVHDLEIDAAVFNHVSGYFADVVWHGLSTYHVRESLEKGISLDELRDLWRPISPMTYMPKLAGQQWRPQRYIYTRYDLTFPYDLSIKAMAELDRLKIRHDEAVLPCGHYTLGEKPWNYLDGYKIVTFLRKHLTRS
ncbi:MAG: abhydrolase domain-containing 18, partial [Acidobacteria bacterium]|nr:abhydrolase domain-containing 18 [Acidobacteriota bacterium]